MHFSAVLGPSLCTKGLLKRGACVLVSPRTNTLVATHRLVILVVRRKNSAYIQLRRKSHFAMMMMIASAKRRTALMLLSLLKFISKLLITIIDQNRRFHPSDEKSCVKVRLFL